MKSSSGLTTYISIPQYDVVEYTVYPGTSTVGDWTSGGTITAPNPITSPILNPSLNALAPDLYLIHCPHCELTFVSRQCLSALSMESGNTCWEAQCPHCESEIRLSLQGCSANCPHAMECLLMGLVDKLLAKGMKLEVDKKSKPTPDQVVTWGAWNPGPFTAQPSYKITYGATT